MTLTTAILGLGLLFANLAVFGFTLKLYTEIMKEKAQRGRQIEPTTNVALTLDEARVVQDFAKESQLASKVQREAEAAVVGQTDAVERIEPSYIEPTRLSE